MHFQVSAGGAGESIKPGVERGAAERNPRFAAKHQVSPEAGGRELSIARFAGSAMWPPRPGVSRYALHPRLYADARFAG